MNQIIEWRGRNGQQYTIKGVVDSVGENAGIESIWSAAYRVHPHEYQAHGFGEEELARVRRALCEAANAKPDPMTLYHERLEG